MSSSFEASVLVLEAKRAKLEREIEVECATYSQNVLTDHVGYKYYTREIENYSAKDECAIGIIESHSLEKIKKKEAELENFTNKINKDIEAIRNIADVKKQAILDKSSMIKEGYLTKLADIEANHKRPTSMGFRKKEEALSKLTEEIAHSNVRINEECERKLKNLREEANIRIEEARRKEALEKQEALNKFYEDRAQTRKEEEMRQKARDLLPPVDPGDWANTVVERISHGVAPAVKRIKLIRIPYTNQDISKMSQDEIDMLDQTKMTKEQVDALADRYEILEGMPIESKHLNSEFYADRKAVRKAEKKAVPTNEN